jgi:general nucleoside transport system permease protein
MTRAVPPTSTSVQPDSHPPAEGSDDTVVARLAARGRRKALWLVAVLVVMQVLLAADAGGQHAKLDIGAGAGRGPVLSAPVWLFCGVGVLLALVAMAAIRTSDASRSGRMRVVLCVLVSLLALVVGLLAWAARSGQANVGGVLAVSVGGAIPIMLGSTAGVLSERSGVFNIAIEAEFLAGAFVSALVGSTTHSALFGLITGILAGAAVGLLLALMAIRYRVDQVVAGIILISLVTGLTGYLTEQVLTPNADRLNSPATFHEISVPLLDRLPIVGQPLFNQSPLFYLAIVVVIAVEFLLRRTRVGLRIRAVGESPAAAESSGIKVRRLRYLSVSAAGAVAGAGGAYFTVGSTGQFVAGMSSGLGYVALAAVILGSWRPAPAAAAALLFGFASSIATTFGLLKVNISPSLLLMAPYVVTIVVVAGVTVSGKAPAAAGGRLDD